jgi:hypothetical protein
MANAMHNSWKTAKSGLQKQIDDVKKSGGLNPKQIQDALKSFDSGFGPLLDKCAKAYKDKKDADVKKYAKDAITVAEKYLGTVTSISNERGSGAKITLKAMITQLTNLRDKGITAPNYF